MSVPINRGSDPISTLVYALIFNAVTAAVTDEHFMLLSERERVTAAIYDTLRGAGVEIRIRDGLEHLRQVAVDLDPT